MIRIAPFRGLFYNQKKVRDLSKVVAPPYDVISKEEQERLYKKSPYNFIRLDLSQEPDSYSAVAQLLSEWLATGIFERDETPAIYFLSHRFKLKSGEQKIREGFLALTELQDFSSGDIRPHEKTLDAPKEDRLKLMLACHAQLSPILALYSQPKQSINRMLAVEVEGVEPSIEIEQDNGEQCRLWRIANAELIEKVQQEMSDQQLLIADGHHRYEATLSYRDWMRRERGQWNGREAFNFIMAYFANINDENVVIMPTHRLVPDTPTNRFSSWKKRCKPIFTSNSTPRRPKEKFHFSKR